LKLTLVSGNRDTIPLLCCHGCAADKVGKITTPLAVAADRNADGVINDSNKADPPEGPVRAARDQAAWHICLKEDDIFKGKLCPIYSKNTATDTADTPLIC